ncbi:MAG: sulfatase-like hydrolase/transferase [Candidatus Marinimicrobia bacterium]|nr:sulfatase-like hydrolase/transferase [Candidatus Neomarinimicrobiota bacterium]
MRVIYFDVDTLRPDHLGCYGYHRNTSPNIDRIAKKGISFSNCYTSNPPCLPSRTALWSGRFGIHSGVEGHGGTAADPFLEGPERWFLSNWGISNWMHLMRKQGFKTITFSPFAERHSAWQWYAGYSEMHNPGKSGEEVADDITPSVLDWIENNAQKDDWFLHVNYWDPHTPYRTPEKYGDPFKDDALPKWYTEEVRKRHWHGCGSWSAQEGMGYGGYHPYVSPDYPRQPNKMSSLKEVRRMFDGYDTGIRYADEHIGRVLNALNEKGIHEDTAIIISGDHGENLGELNIYYDHQTADQFTARVPLIIHWPGITDSLAGETDTNLHYQFDLAATIVDLLGGKIPDNWDAKSFAGMFEGDQDACRDYLVITQCAHTCQRSVRFDNFICIRSYHDGFHNFPDIMLFDLENDSHEQNNIAEERPQKVGEAMKILTDWNSKMMRTAVKPSDPLFTVLKEGGPLHTRDGVKKYIERLRETGRADCAQELIKSHPEIFNKNEN